MRVGIATEGHTELLRAYHHTASTVHAAAANLAPLIREAAALLTRPTPNRPHAELAEVASALDFDARDLERRGDFIRNADAALAARINARAGDPVNVALARDAVANGWTYRESQLRHELATLRQLPIQDQIRRASEIRVLESNLAIIDAPHSVAGTLGDDHAELTRHRVNPPLRITETDAVDRGRALVTRALHDTGDPDRILQDEFSAILHDNGNLTLVLAGVTDFSAPDPGYHDVHRTYRDTDQEAWHSARSAALEDNGYGRRVREWVQMQVRSGVIEPGAKTVIVGHSFGGDTALDLAADAEFNGDWVDITHVVPMAYHNEPQFEAVPGKTQVLALQNILDVVVFVESVNADTWRLLDEHYANDESASMATRVAIEGAEGAVNGASWLVNESINRVEGAVEENWGATVEVPDIGAVEFKGDDYRRIAPHITLVEFEGGFAGAGHHQSNYQDFLDRSDRDEVLRFWGDLDAHGFTADGVSVSIDVSKPKTGG